MVWLVVGDGLLELKGYGFQFVLYNEWLRFPQLLTGGYAIIRYTIQPPNAH